MYKRYVLTLLGAFIAFMMLIATINIVIDPYRIFNFISAQGFNAIKPFQQNTEQVFKPIEVARKTPEFVIVGSSRVQYGFDPNEAERLTGLRSYNLGIDGATAYELQSFLNFAVKNTKTKVVMIGLDLMAFNGSRPLYNSRFNPSRMSLTLKEGAWGYLDMQEAFRYIFSWQTFRDSLTTPLNQRLAPFYDANGFIPKQNVDQSEFINFTPLVSATLSAYGDMHRNDASSYYLTEDSLNLLDYFDQMIAYGANHDVTFILVVNPLHELFIKELERNGLSSALKDWHSEILRRVASARRRNPCSSILLADYLIDPRNQEVFPVSVGGKMHYWNDSYHFSHVYGDEIMREIFIESNLLRRKKNGLCN